MLAAGAPLCELGDGSTEGGSDESGSAYIKVGHTYSKSGMDNVLPACNVSAKQATSC